MKIILNEETFNEISLVNTIKQMVRHFKEEYSCSLRDINKGLCIDFTESVIDVMGGETDKFFELGTDMFWDEFKDKYNVESWGKNGGIIETEYGIWSKKMLDTYGHPKKDLQKINLLNHSWIYYNKKHYDAEAPNGVDFWYELPIFKRSLK